MVTWEHGYEENIWKWGRGSNSRMDRTVQEVTSRFVGLLSRVELYWGGQIKGGETGGILCG